MSFNKKHFFFFVSYHANSWLVKITSNGRYILAPTIYGQIFVFNMSTGKVSAIIKEHEGKKKKLHYKYKLINRFYRY